MICWNVTWQSITPIIQHDDTSDVLHSVHKCSIHYVTQRINRKCFCSMCICTGFWSLCLWSLRQHHSHGDATHSHTRGTYTYVSWYMIWNDHINKAKVAQGRVSTTTLKMWFDIIIRTSRPPHKNGVPTILKTCVIKNSHAMETWCISYRHIQFRGPRLLTYRFPIQLYSVHFIYKHVSWLNSSSTYLTYCHHSSTFPPYLRR